MERRLLQPLIEWTLDDVESLIGSKVPEGQRLDYKSQLNLERAKQKHEAAKDASGFANASGGLLIYGVAEEELPDGEVVPTELEPLTDASVRERLDDVLDSTVSPVLNLDRRLLDVDHGYVLLVRVFQRAGALHVVEGFRDGAHYLRVGHKTRRMAQHEIERDYANLGRQDDRLHELLVHSRPTARLTMSRSQHQIVLASKGITTEPKWRPWMHVVTAPLDGPDPLLPMRTASPRGFEESREGKLMRDNLSDGHFTIDAGGYLREARVSPESPMLAASLRLYRSGVFEYGWRFFKDDWETIPATALLEHTHDALLYFARVYAAAGYHGRVRAFVGIDNADKGVFWIDNSLTDPDYWATEQELAEDLRTPEDAHVDSLLQDPMPVVHRAMDYIWQSFGHSRCLLFSEDGAYCPPR